MFKIFRLVVKNMDKPLVIIGIATLLIGIGLSGCVQQSPNKPSYPSLPDTIRFEDIVWTANNSIATEPELRDLFNFYGLQFWETSLDFLRSHGLYYPGNYTPLLGHMGVNLIELTSVNPQNTSQKWGPPQWTIVIPAIKENAEWRIGNDGIIEEKLPSEDTWRDAAHIWFLTEQQNGTVRVIC